MKITKHARIRERIARELREADHKAADHPAQRRKEAEASRLLEILTDIAVEDLRRQAFEETGSGKDESL